jgi:hypothetical protein
MGIETDNHIFLHLSQLVFSFASLLRLDRRTEFMMQYPRQLLVENLMR